MLSENTKDILRNVTKVFEHENLRMTASTTGQAGLIAGACTMAGGLFGGQYGVVLGGLAGAALNTYLTPEFKAVPDIIKNEMTDEQKSNLAKLVQDVLAKVPGSGAMSGLLSNEAVRAAVITTVMRYVTNQHLGSSSGCRKF